MVNQGIAFWFMFLAGRRWLPASQALLAVMLTSLVPLFGPDTGFKFNANSAMLPWIAVFVWSLIVAFQTSRWRYLLIAGVAAGAACLIKYWAPLMLFSVLCGSLLILGKHPNWSWKTTPKNLIVLSGISALIFGPHFSWAINHHWPSLQYAHEAHPLSDSAGMLNDAIDLLFDLSLAALIPCVAWLLSVSYLRFATPRSPQVKAAQISSPRIGRRMVSSASIFVIGVVLTLIAANFVHVTVVPKWLIPAWLFFSWFLCSLLPENMNAKRLIRPLGALIGLYWVGLVIYVVATIPAFDMTRDATNQRRLIANEVSSEFLTQFGKPLSFVAGEPALAFSTSFYSPDHPLAIPKVDFKRASWVSANEVKSKGMVVLCEPSKNDCLASAIARVGQPFKTAVWKGLSDTGEPSTVLELFYPPQAR
jgi:4-amino-4-deoxy-L-arabinose transferase-like glycosyltransferase